MAHHANLLLRNVEAPEKAVWKQGNEMIAITSWVQCKLFCPVALICTPQNHFDLTNAEVKSYSHLREVAAYLKYQPCLLQVEEHHTYIHCRSDQATFSTTAGSKTLSCQMHRRKSFRAACTNFYTSPCNTVPRSHKPAAS